MSVRVDPTRPAAQPDFGFLARRTVVGVAAAAALVGILAGRPVLSVAWRAGAIALVALLAIRIVERCVLRTAAAGPQARGGAR